jgi:hypothetical protein
MYFMNIGMYCSVRGIFQYLVQYSTVQYSVQYSTVSGAKAERGGSKWGGEKLTRTLDISRILGEMQKHHDTTYRSQQLATNTLLEMD